MWFAQDCLVKLENPFLVRYDRHQLQLKHKQIEFSFLKLNSCTKSTPIDLFASFQEYSCSIRLLMWWTQIKMVHIVTRKCPLRCRSRWIIIILHDWQLNNCDPERTVWTKRKIPAIFFPSCTNRFHRNDGSYQGKFNRVEKDLNLSLRTFFEEIKFDIFIYSEQSKTSDVASYLSNT